MESDVRQQIPVLATLGNLMAGSLAMILVLDGRPDLAALCIIAAVLLDSVDGALARMFNSCSDFGGELDSLADVVSFGVAPALLVVSLQGAGPNSVSRIAAVCFVLATAWRLARFNVYRAFLAGHEDFIGLPTTGAGACVAAAVLMHGFLENHGFEAGAVLMPWLLLALSLLMVSSLPYPHVGTLIARWPGAFVLAGLATLWVAVTHGAYEVVFVALSLSYVGSGPVAALGAKVKAVREARSS